MTETLPALVDVDVTTDGDRYRLGFTANTVWLHLLDSMGDDALVHLTPTDAARLRDNLSRTIIAGGRTSLDLNIDQHVAVLRGTLYALDEMRKHSPDAVTRVYCMLLNHIRNSVPDAVREAQERGL